MRIDARFCSPTMPPPLPPVPTGLNPAPAPPSPVVPVAAGGTSPPSPPPHPIVKKAAANTAQKNWFRIVPGYVRDAHPLKGNFTQGEFLKHDWIH
jgi:hypothetical protein